MPPNVKKRKASQQATQSPSKRCLRSTIKKAKDEPKMEFKLPDEEWLTEMYGPSSVENSAPSSSASLKRKRVKKPTKNGPSVKRIKLGNKPTSSNSNEDIEIIQISDGEDLNEAFPPAVNVGQKEQNQMEMGENDDNTGENNQAEDGDSSDNEIFVLFDSVGQRTPKKELIDHNAMEQIGESSKKGTSDEKIAECSLTINIEKVTTPAPPQSKPIITTELKGKAIHWPEVFGVHPKQDEHCFKRISKYRKEYAAEFEKFDKDIWTHMTENIQNDQTYTWKMRVKNLLLDRIRMAYPMNDIELIAVGSTINGCGAFNSDMDLCLCFLDMMDGFETSRSFAIKYLKKIGKILLQQSDLVHGLQYIPAKVPILKMNFKHPYQALEVDMNVNNLPGIYNSYLLHYYSRIDDRFSALCLLVKNWAKKNNILDASLGFFNSYSLILMVLHFLQCGTSPPVLPNLQALYPEYFSFNKRLKDMKLFEEFPQPLPEVAKNERSVGELLIAFFDYYNNFSFERKAISVNKGRTFLRKLLPKNTARFKVYIEEPFDLQNTARCVTCDTNWEVIQEAFARAAGIFNYNYAPNLRKLI